MVLLRASAMAIFVRVGHGLAMDLNPSYHNPERREKIKILFSHFVVVPQKVLGKSLRPS